MPKQNTQKAKLLLLLEMLRQDSDEGHPLRTREICNRLAESGISCERRTLYKDMALLNELGFEVMSVMCGHEKGYYVDDRSFSMPELKILIDAIQAANFITPKKTEELVDKIAALGGSNRANVLKSNAVCFNTKKHRNETILYAVDTIESALAAHQKVSFLYFDLDEHCRRIYRKGKNRYLVEPISLVLMDDRYYLLARSQDREGNSIYRIDKMEQVQPEAEAVSSEALREQTSVANYTGQTVRMFAGKPAEVVLRFSEKAIGAVYDEFGEDTAIERLDDTTCQAKVTVQVSPTFWGWLFQFGEWIDVIAPEQIVAQYAERVQAIMRKIAASKVAGSNGKSSK